MNTLTTFNGYLKQVQASFKADPALLVGDFPAVLERIALNDSWSALVELKRTAKLGRDALKKRVNGFKQQTPKRVITDAEILEASRELIFWNLIDSAAFRYEESAPVIHHWIPVCYIRSFTGNAVSAKRIVKIECTTYGPDREPYLSMPQDQEFAHGRQMNGEGFYALAVEKFFSWNESYYGLYSQNQNAATENMALPSLIAFMVSLNVRDPHSPAADPSPQTLEGLTLALAKAYDALEGWSGKIVHSSREFNFTAHSMGRYRRLNTGELTYSFPLSMSYMLVMASSPLSRERSKRVARASQRNLLAAARRSQGKIYGPYPKGS